jgi:hypothetical protein
MEKETGIKGNSSSLKRTPARELAIDVYYKNTTKIIEDQVFLEFWTHEKAGNQKNL